MYINKLPILLILYVYRIGKLKVFHIAVVSSLQTLDLQHRDFDSMSVRRVDKFHCFLLHAGAMDSFARGLLNAERILNEGVIAKQVKV